MSEKFLYIITSLVIVSMGIFAYHYFVTLELLDILERIQASSNTLSIKGGSPLSDFSGEISQEGEGQDVQDLKADGQALETITPSNLTFQIPHYIYSGGQQQIVNINAKILNVTKYYSVKSSAYTDLEISICKKDICNLPGTTVPVNRLQAVIAFDIEFANNNRMGAIAFDPAKQFRLSHDSDFYVLSAAGHEGEDYIQILELATEKVTFITRVPREDNKFNLIFGADLESPTGIFQIDFDKGTIDALIG